MNTTNEHELKEQDDYTSGGFVLPALELSTVIELPALKDNSVVVIRINQEVNDNIINSISNLIRKYETILQEKNCTVLFLEKNTQIETLNESQMNSAGWYKKSLIIT